MSSKDAKMITLEMVREKLFTAVIADALDQHGWRNQLVRAQIPAFTGIPRLAGRAKTTLWTDMAHDDPKPYEMELAAVDKDCHRLLEPDSRHLRPLGQRLQVFWQGARGTHSGARLLRNLDSYSSRFYLEIESLAGILVEDHSLSRCNSSFPPEFRKKINHGLDD